MIYEFQGPDGSIVEKNYRVGKCPKSIKIKGIKFKKIISLPMMANVIGTENQTLGSLADKNTKKMQKKGDPRVKEVKAPIPWWRKDGSKPDLSLNKMSKSKKAEYIRTGKK